MKRWRWLLVIALLFIVWAAWSEFNPETERELRVLVHDRLDTWFPEQMAPTPLESGFVRGGSSERADASAQVILVHGLDEPGGIWTELARRFEAEGIDYLEFRYANDQAVDASADDLARHWPRLEANRPVVLIGHSMGGLVIRDFVGRHRHPVDSRTAIDGPPVAGAILIATPNRGSEWARLRAWLELREYAADLPAGRFSLFAALRDGTGAAKIDLRPGSAFLQTLNARPWPEGVPIRIIGGQLTEPTPAMNANLRRLTSEMGLPELERTISGLWSDGGEAVGDGAVPVDSLPLPEAPPPLILPASHRGLIAQMPWSEDEPPAIGPVIDTLDNWLDSTPRERAPADPDARPD